MPDSDIEKPIEKIQEAAQAAAHAETAPPRVRRYRTVLFQTALLAVVLAFTVLAYWSVRPHISPSIYALPWGSSPLIPRFLPN
jgi:hypothetical protein